MPTNLSTPVRQLAELKIVFPYGIVGSTPTSGIDKKRKSLLKNSDFFYSKGGDPPTRSVAKAMERRRPRLRRTRMRNNLTHSRPVVRSFNEGL